jgi:hypothetical protein
MIIKVEYMVNYLRLRERLLIYISAIQWQEQVTFGEMIVLTCPPARNNLKCFEKHEMYICHILNDRAKQLSSDQIIKIFIMGNFSDVHECSYYKGRFFFQKEVYGRLNKLIINI